VLKTHVAETPDQALTLFLIGHAGKYLGVTPGGRQLLDPLPDGCKVNIAGPVIKWREQMLERASVSQSSLSGDPLFLAGLPLPVPAPRLSGNQARSVTPAPQPK
jgi:hypothetical protein